MSLAPLRVLHVYRTYFPDPPGGLQEAVRQICLSMQPFDVENTIFTLSPTPEPVVVQRPEGRVVRCRAWAAPASCDLGGPTAFSRFRRLAREADVVHYFFPWPFADVLHQCVGPQTPAVLTYISDIVRQKWLGTVYAPLMRRTLSSVRAVIANAPAYARTSPVLSQLGLSAKVQVIPLGIDEQSHPQNRDDTILSRLGLHADEPYFLFIGVLRYYKGLQYLVQAARMIGAPVVIAGSGPESEALRQMTADLQVTNVVFAGQVSDQEKLSLIQHCRALVLPSHLRSEAFGMVLVEAAMYARPMVSCEIGTGTSFVNVNEETGLVVEPANPEALAQAMVRLLSDRALSVRMGAAARERYEKMFSGRALGQSYATLFRNVADHGHA